MTTAVALPIASAAVADQADITRSTPRSLSGSLTLRLATPDDAHAIHGLIARHLDEGHLLPRHLGEITVHAHRFVVAVNAASEGPATAGVGEEVIGCADLAPLSRTVAEVRSLVVTEAARSTGVGSRLIDALVAQASTAGFERLCAFTHAPAYFVQLGFSIVPHEWLPEKIKTDCGTCALFRRCGQYAVMLPLTRARQSSTSAKAPADKCVPLTSVHG